MSAGFLVAYSAVIALAQGQFVPAHYREGALPAIPMQAVGAGEVFLELTVSRTGEVTAVGIVRATPPFTDVLAAAVGQWRFVPAEEPERELGGTLEVSKTAGSKVLVVGLFRPPSFDTPALGERPADLASASDELPFPLARTMPPYPPRALNSGIVLVEVRVDSRGNVADARAIRSSPPFDEPAIAAARRWKFRPAYRHGASIDAIAYIVFAFRQPVIVTQRSS